MNGVRYFLPRIVLAVWVILVALIAFSSPSILDQKKLKCPDGVVVRGVENIYYCVNKEYLKEI